MQQNLDLHFPVPEAVQALALPPSAKSEALLPLDQEILLSLDEFAHADALGAWLARGFRFSVFFQRNLSAWATDLICQAMAYPEQIRFVVVARKDWRFRDAYRAFPHFARSRLFLDFPVSLGRGDPFYSPKEVESLKRELSSYFPGTQIRSFAPHAFLRKELLRARVVNLSAPGKLAESRPRLTIITCRPAVIDVLAASAVLPSHTGQVEILVPRVAGQKTQVIRRIPGVVVSRIWAHLNVAEEHSGEISALLKNAAAPHANGEILWFLDETELSKVEAGLKALLEEDMPPEMFLLRGLGTACKTDIFQKIGGFDPLFAFFAIEDQELAYRALGADRILSPEGRLFVEQAQNTLRGEMAKFGWALHYHETGDDAFYQAVTAKPLLESSTQRDARGIPLLDRFRYRLEQSRDAYFSLYQASPKVAIQGNFQILLRPWHFLKQHLWRIKMPVYPLFVQPYHLVRQHVWRWKILAWKVSDLYWLLTEVFWKFASIYFFLRAQLWRWKQVYYVFWWIGFYTFWSLASVYYFIKGQLWRWKQVYYVFWWAGFYVYWSAAAVYFFFQGNAWRWKQVYYFCWWTVFYLSFPLRKTFYFLEFQYEKRILGLHSERVAVSE